MKRIFRSKGGKRKEEKRTKKAKKKTRVLLFFIKFVSSLCVTLLFSLLLVETRRTRTRTRTRTMTTTRAAAAALFCANTRNRSSKSGVKSFLFFGGKKRSSFCGKHHHSRFRYLSKSSYSSLGTEEGWMRGKRRKDINNDENNNSSSSLDAIVVVAGGFTPDNLWLPEWVLERLDYCAEAHKKANEKAYICIAGSATPHKPPPLQKGGFIYHESTMMAEYLIDTHDVHPGKILKDTSSMDTIGNAYFTRYVHAIPRGWKNVEVVTSKFHMRRVKAAFEWVWGMPLEGNGNEDTQIRFVSTRDSGLSKETLIAREEREIESEKQLRENAKMYDTPDKFAEWMFTTHKCYAVTRQHEIGDFEAVKKELGSNAEKLGY